jgi:hypothetical protein
MKNSNKLSPVVSETENYIVGMLTKYGITRLNTGKTYNMVDALARAKKLNSTCEPELKYLGGERYVAVTVYE